MSSWGSSHTIMRAMSNGFAGWLRSIRGGVVGSGGAGVRAICGGGTGRMIGSENSCHCPRRKWMSGNAARLGYPAASKPVPNAVIRSYRDVRRGWITARRLLAARRGKRQFVHDGGSAATRPRLGRSVTEPLILEAAVYPCSKIGSHGRSTLGLCRPFVMGR